MAVPRRYSEVGNQGTVASTFKTALTVIASTSTRGALYFFNLGTTGTAADGVLEWRLSRFTAAGTTTAVTPVALDGADPAALLTAGSNASGEPTYTWIAVPGGELLVPATASNGIGVTVLSVVAPAYTGAANASVHHFE
jgi:hypothetical protein